MAAFCLRQLEGFTHSEIFSRLLIKRKSSLVKLCRMMCLEDAVERIEQMDAKVATVADFVKYAVLQQEETPDELLLHGEPID